MVGEEGVNLSGGQVQLVALARALVSNPQLLLLDEAFSAMGRDMRRFAYELISNLKENRGIILATHDIGTALKADRIYILEDGIISDTGTPDELLNRETIVSMEYQNLMRM